MICRLKNIFKKSSNALILSAFVLILASCEVQNLPQRDIPEEKIEVFWDQHDRDDFKISYSSDTSDVEVADVNDSVTEIKLKIDTANVEKKLLAEIYSWVGTPYKYAGHSRSGTDCSGFTMEVYLAVYGIRLNRSASGQVANTEKIKKADLQLGDLIFFNTRGNRISHVGIYIGDNKFAHASSKRGVVIDDLDENYYTRNYVQSGRVKHDQAG